MTTIDFHPDARKLRQFAWAWLAFVAGAWPVLAFLRGHRRAAIVALAIGVVGWALGMVKPTLLKWPFVGLSIVTWPIGQVVGRIAIALVFYLVITPMGLVMRLFGRDPLHRRFDTKSPTYWRPHETSTPESYLRQS